jgi:hypothetical protein
MWKGCAVALAGDLRADVDVAARRTPRACSVMSCSIVDVDVAPYDVSDLLRTWRRSLCPSCLACLRLDPFLIVEAVT